MTREQEEILLPHIENMRIAHEYGWCRNIKRADRKGLLSVYKDITGKDYREGLECGTCQSNFLSELYGLYQQRTEVCQEPVHSGLVDEGLLKQDDSSNVGAIVRPNELWSPDKSNKRGNKRVSTRSKRITGDNENGQ